MPLTSRAGAVLFAALTAIPACAQFRGLATPADGSQLYFSMRLRQKGSSQPLWGKLFGAGPAGIALLESRERLVPDPPPPGIAVGLGMAQPTTPYDIRASDISSDGSVVAVAAWRGCVSGGSYCFKIENFFTTVSANGKAVEYPGNLRLSANGRWAFGQGSHPTRPDDYPYTAYLVDLGSGTTTNLQDDGSVSTNGRPVANDGTAVLGNRGGVVLIRGASRQQIAADGYALDPVIDAAGKTIIWTACSDGNCTDASLQVGDTTTGEHRQLAASGRAACLSDDGRTALFLRGDTVPQAWVIGIDGTGERQLTHDPDGIAQAILSGGGRTSYAVTLGGRLVRIDVASGSVEEIVPRTPALDDRMLQSIIPDGIVTLKGFALSDGLAIAEPPLPDSVGGVGVTIQGITAKILAVQPDAVTIFSPPSLEPPADGLTLSRIVLTAPSESPFEASSIDALILRVSPQFLGSPVHQDWSELVTPDHPATAGEILHSYATALGPTIPPVAYGDAAPISPPLAVLVTPSTCATAFPPGGTPIQVLWQGLAPGLAGVYQIDWQVPASLSQPMLALFCFQGPAWFVQAVPVTPTAPVPRAARELR
jgi:uncharacterized protein (TIGR03437 family)